MVIFLPLLLGQAAGTIDPKILTDLEEKGLVAGLHAFSGGALDRGIVRDPTTGYEGRWIVPSSKEGSKAYLTLTVRFDRVIDREVLRSRLKPDELKAMVKVYLPLGNEVQIPAGTSDAPNRRDWETAVTIARTIQEITRAKTVPLERNPQRPQKPNDIPWDLRVTALMEVDMEQIATQRGWPDANVGGVSGRSPISRAAAPRAFVYAFGFEDDSPPLFAGETRRVYIDPQFSLINVKTTAQRRMLEAALPGWSFNWDESGGEGGSARWTLDLTPGYRVGEIVQALERESLRSVAFRKRYGEQFLMQFGGEL